MAAIIAICITILLTATDISVGNRILIVLFVIVTLIPSIFLTLFEITCMVTGGTEPNRWWCYAFAWVLAAFIIIYCIFVVIISIVSLFTYNNAIDTINQTEQKNKISDTDSNHIAKQIIHTEEEKKKIEDFYGASQTNEQFRTYGVQPRPVNNGTNWQPTAINRDNSGLSPSEITRQAHIKAYLDSRKNRRGFQNREDFQGEQMEETEIPNAPVQSSGENFENRENFGAEPMNALTPPIVPVPPQQKQNEIMAHNASFDMFSDYSSEGFQNSEPSGGSNIKLKFSNFIDTNNLSDAGSTMISQLQSLKSAATSNIQKLF
jgi:uncharacterized membrane protein